jgi:hypothetical protein
MITEFILTLVILTNSGVAITTIPGYSTEKECIAAGKIYLKDVDDNWNRAKVSCIPRLTEK